MLGLLSNFCCELTAVISIVSRADSTVSYGLQLWLGLVSKNRSSRSVRDMRVAIGREREKVLSIGKTCLGAFHFC